MVQVPTQTFVVNFFGGVILSSVWWYITRDLIYKLYSFAEDPLNFVEVQVKDKADDMVSKDSNTVAEDSNTVTRQQSCQPTDK